MSVAHVSVLIVHLPSTAESQPEPVSREIEVELDLGVEILQAQVSSVLEEMGGPAAWTLVGMPSLLVLECGVCCCCC